MNAAQKELIPLMLKEAHQSLEAAHDLLATEKYRQASVLAYAAVFHGMKALLETEDISASKHGRVMGEVNRRFIHAGRIDPAASDLIERLFNHRQKGFYGYTDQITEDMARQDVADAEKLLAEIERLLAELSTGLK
jgi:uncharacterized protein